MIIILNPSEKNIIKDALRLRKVLMRKKIESGDKSSKSILQYIIKIEALEDRLKDENLRRSSKTHRM